MSRSHVLLPLLNQLEQALKALNIWQDTPPVQEKLMSSEPFAIDTLTPSEWLQWIFMPKMQWLIEQKQPLPSGFSITPYFEEAWKEQPEMHDLVALLKQIDEACA
ncbi:YqcC family protein [Vibrio agarivorans]|uniref:YqcC family protein n=1 Tax=Vibrio agarivorans TaxID=153622 RepID=UPI0022317ACA|nr:YqcC family protein [Vibrio agarivorans]MDN3661372.1 YqcC family protein [Vibrio agarivorans]